jgi:hypothetical protein
VSAANSDLPEIYVARLAAWEGPDGEVYGPGNWWVVRDAGPETIDKLRRANYEVVRYEPVREAVPPAT